MSLKEIAKVTGFSQTTVSRALNDYDDVNIETKRIIKEAARKLNYIPNLNAKRLATNSSRRIGFVIIKFGSASGEDNFMYEVLLGILKSSSILHYESVIIPVTNEEFQDEPNFLTNLAKKNDLCAMVLMGIEKNTKYYRQLKNIKIPIVCIDGDVETDFVGHVSIDNEKAYFEITKHVIDNAKNTKQTLNIIFMSGRENSIVCNSRQKGFERAICESNKNITVSVYFGDYNEKKSYDIVSSLISQKAKIDAIVCANDMMAIGAKKAFLQNHINIPEEVQITGCDNIPLSHYTHPSMSTVSVDKFEMGYKSVELVDNILNQRGQNRAIIVPYKILLRESTK